MGGQNSCLQFLVLPALEVVDVVDERCHGLDDVPGEPVEDILLFLQLCDVTVLGERLNYREPHLRLIHGKVREEEITG
jgi:hypothetical protein